ncbi:hypothetical protein Anas_01443 [Armadillidium nasatum]|uniref:Uncharacterized protein n=1 Tax=Armadillidium nasatum TaxID=96803 RepID=A0A5N5TLF2_9CRUS|nr:hypothetical protein Anas_01443 [Armadillidium nasatum]
MLRIFHFIVSESRKLKFRKDCTNSYFTVANAVRCLIIGKKYEGVFHLAFQHKDINLCLFTLSLGIENHINGKEIPSMTNYLLRVLIQLLPPNSDKLPFTDSLFLIEQLLYLGVLEGLEDLLILSLRKCLSEVESLMEALPLIVPFDFSLPSPPLFCPQIDTTYPVSYDEESKSEIFIREKLSQWITSFCLLCVAANVDELLTKYTIETELKPQMKRKHINQFYTPLSNGKENLLLENDSQWTELKLIWQRLFKCFYALHTRDNLSLSVRTCVEAKRDMCKMKKVQELSSVILEKSDRISSLKKCWESDAFFIVLTSALEAPCTAETAHFVARNVARQTRIPSLCEGET